MLPRIVFVQAAWRRVVAGNGCLEAVAQGSSELARDLYSSSQIPSIRALAIAWDHEVRKQIQTERISYDGKISCSDQTCAGLGYEVQMPL